jgi:hypothetical protein
MDMSMLWAVPPVAATIGVLIGLAQLRRIDDATRALAGQLRQLGEVRVAVTEVRAASLEARAAARGLRLR